jgi:hypothetical protein
VLTVLLLIAVVDLIGALWTERIAEGSSNLLGPSSERLCERGKQSRFNEITSGLPRRKITPCNDG